MTETEQALVRPYQLQYIDEAARDILNEVIQHEDYPHFAHDDLEAFEQDFLPRVESAAFGAPAPIFPAEVEVELVASMILARIYQLLFAPELTEELDF